MLDAAICASTDQQLSGLKHTPVERRFSNRESIDTLVRDQGAARRRLCQTAAKIADTHIPASSLEIIEGWFEKHGVVKPRFSSSSEVGVIIGGIEIRNRKELAGHNTPQFEQ